MTHHQRTPPSLHHTPLPQEEAVITPQQVCLTSSEIVQELREVLLHVQVRNGKNVAKRWRVGVLFGQSAFSRSAASSGEGEKQAWTPPRGREGGREEGRERVGQRETTPAICGQTSPRTQPTDIVCTRTTATSRPFELEPLMMEWLDDLGLRDSVKQRFIHERIDCEHLALMSHDQLEQLGVNKVFTVHLLIVAIMIVHDIPCYDKCIHRWETDSSS